jgi:PAS domain S-box-containing protein
MDNSLGSLITEARLGERIGHDPEPPAHDAISPQSYLEQATELVVALDGAGNVIYESPSVARSLGYAPGQAHVDGGFHGIHPGDLDAAERAFREVLSERSGRRTVDVRVLHAAGNWRWLRATATNRLHEPSVGAVLVTAVDVTERRAAEAEGDRHVAEWTAVNRFGTELERAEEGLDFHVVLGEKLREITGALLVITTSIDMRSGLLSIRSVAAQPEALARARRDIGRRLRGASLRVSAEKIHMIGRESVRIADDLTALTLGAVGKPLAASLRADLRFGRLAGIVLRTDQGVSGTAVLAMPHASPGPSLTLLHALGQVASILLQRRSMTEAMLRTERRMGAILDATRDIVLVTDPCGVVEVCNPSAARYFGVRRAADLVGRRAEEILPGLSLAHPELPADRDIRVVPVPGGCTGPILGHVVVVPGGADPV